MHLRNLSMLLVAALIAGCGGGGNDTNDPTNVTLTAGQQVTMSAGETAWAPSGFSTNDHGTVVTIIGHHNTSNVHAGTVVTVSANPEGAADNQIIAK